MIAGTVDHISAAPRLRKDLEIEVRDGGVDVVDPVTRRRFRFRDGQAEVVGFLDGHRSPEEIADRVAGRDQLPAITGFLARLSRLGLLDGPDLEEGDVALLQAREMREPARLQRDRRVAEVVRWAAEQLPFYRERIGDLAPTVRGVQDLARLPTTTKTDLRDHFPAGFIEEGSTLQELATLGKVVLLASSGSTGGRVPALVDGYAGSSVFAHRHPGMRASGDFASMRMAFFTTPNCSAQVCLRTSTYEERLRDEGRQLMITSSERVMKLRREEIDKIVSDFERYRPDCLHIDPTYAVALVRALERHGISIPRVRSIFSGYEFLSGRHERILSQAFGVPIYQIYGATEINNDAAFTCEKGRFHAVDETHVFEFLKDGGPVPPGEVGAVAVTQLRTRTSTLIRYLVGDLGTPLEECGCQFDDLPAFHLEGRAQEVLFTTSNAPVTTRAVDQLFDGLDWVDFYQLVQRDRDRYELFAVPCDGMERAEDERMFLDRSRALFGADAQISIEYVRELPMNPSLKYSLTRNMMSGDGFRS
jgi:phenylacetate-CoA ligase